MLKTFVLSIVASLMAATAWAGPLQEGSYKGFSSSRSLLAKTRGDVMALLLKKDAENPENFYAVLAEYTRVRLGPVGSALMGFNGDRLTVEDRRKVTKWVPRMYAYYVEKSSNESYLFRSLEVTDAGDIVLSEGKPAATLTLDPRSSTLANPLNGATLARPDQKQGGIEVITFDQALLGSTWEDLVVADFFWSHASSGKDYVIKKEANSRIEQDPVSGQARAFLSSTKPVLNPKTGKKTKVAIKGWYSVDEKLPGLFTLKAIHQDNQGNEQVEKRIGLFIDIVNWKELGQPKYTTEEFMLINPEDPSDVGFFYERH